MKIVNKDGCRFLVAENVLEDVLCDWFSLDIQFDVFFKDDLCKLVAGGFSKSNPMIGNKYTVYSSREKVVIFKSKIVDSDEILMYEFENTIIKDLIELI